MLQKSVNMHFCHAAQTQTLLLRVLLRPLLLILGYQFFLQLGGRRGVMAELHRKLSLALARRSQLTAKPKHRVQAAVCREGEVLAACLRVADSRESAAVS